MASTNGHGPKRVVLYARVSTDEQARSGYSLRQQVERLRDHAASEGYEVLEEVLDPGQSGASLQRPGLDRVRDLVAGGGVSVVLAQDRDRFAREPAYHYLLRQEFEEHGTKIRALNDRGDESPEGELTDGILDQLAKYERAKTAERTRRGKLRKVKDGKVLANNCADYGYRYNDTKDGYLVEEETMSVVRRVFRMVGVEGMSLKGVAAALDREGVKPPGVSSSGSGRWSTTTLRNNIIKDDVYKPHTYEEMDALVCPEVAARLDRSKLYGIWWYNRTRTKVTQVSAIGQNGKAYRRRFESTPRPRGEWVAVPVPDSGVPREWVDAAREAIRENRRPSSAGRRFWELSGGILRCGGCGYAMMTTSISSHGTGRFNHYYRCPKRLRDKEACPQPRNWRADRTEPRVWELISGLMTDPAQLRSDRERMIELEREGLRGDPTRDTKAWLEKLAEVERERRGYQRLAAKGRMTEAELDGALAELRETRETVERELTALRGRRERLEELERDKEILLNSYAGLAPEALDSLAPEERHRVYRMLGVRAVAHVGGTLEVGGALAGPIGVSKGETAPSWGFSTPAFGGRR